MSRKITLQIILACVVMLLATTASAQEDMRFVDSDGNTGYYVDVNSITYEDYYLVDARVAVKKAQDNRMYVYAMQFNRLQRTYRLYASKVIRYDTKEVLESKDTGDGDKYYSVTSPMNSIVEYLFSMPGAKIPAPPN